MSSDADQGDDEGVVQEREVAAEPDVESVEEDSEELEGEVEEDNEERESEGIEDRLDQTVGTSAASPRRKAKTKGRAKPKPAKRVTKGKKRKGRR